MKLAIVDKEKCKPAVCGRECKKYCPALIACAVDGSLRGKVHFVEKLTSWKNSVSLGAWRYRRTVL